MKNILFILLSLFAFNSQSFAKAFDLIVTPNHKEEIVKKETPQKPLTGKKLLIMISSGELEKAGMGFALGLSAAQKGVAVTYIIGAKALNSAKKEGIQNQFLAKKMTHRQILQEAIKNGAIVQICYMCSKALGLDEKDFIDGAKIVKSKAIFDKLYEENTKVLSF